MFGLNFIIAMLERQYKDITKQKNEYIYKRKAELNIECYQLLRHVWTLEPYRMLVFSYQQGSDEDEIKIHRPDDEFENYTEEVEDSIR